MPKADTSVKWFHSDMPGAPVLRGEPGALIELLDACLISGFDPRTPDSISVAGEVATVTLGGGNRYDKHAVVAITGASLAGLNAEWRIATSTATTFTFACPGVADGAATGATVKRAPAGWAKPFADVNVGVYQSLDPSSTQLYLRVNDENTRYARVRGYENMTDAATGTGLFPTLGRHAETMFTWAKSTVADSSFRNWALVGDGRLFFFIPCHLVLQTYRGGTMHLFGDFESFTPNDKYACLITAHRNSSPSYATQDHPGCSTSQGRYAARGVSQAGEAQDTVLWIPSSTGNLGGGINTPSQPHTDGNLYFTGRAAVHTTAFDSSALRGFLPGAIASIGRTSVVGYAETKETEGGEALLLVKCTQLGTLTAENDIYVGGTAFDIKGPWR